MIVWPQPLHPASPKPLWFEETHEVDPHPRSPDPTRLGSRLARFPAYPSGPRRPSPTDARRRSNQLVELLARYFHAMVASIQAQEAGFDERNHI